MNIRAFYAIVDTQRSVAARPSAPLHTLCRSSEECPQRGTSSLLRAHTHTHTHTHRYTERERKRERKSERERTPVRWVAE